MAPAPIADTGLSIAVDTIQHEGAIVGRAISVCQGFDLSKTCALGLVFCPEAPAPCVRDHARVFALAFGDNDETADRVADYAERCRQFWGRCGTASLSSQDRERVDEIALALQILLGRKDLPPEIQSHWAFGSVYSVEASAAHMFPIE